MVKIVFLYILAGAVEVMMMRAKRICILMIKVDKLFYFVLLWCFLKEREKMFHRVIETLVKVWGNLKKLWKHSPAARVPTAFLVLPNFHSCLHNWKETRYIFSIS